MSVKLTQEAENERVARDRAQRESSWSFFQSESMVAALHFARDKGWKENKVQVRAERLGNTETYYVEPYEEGCGCRGILRYDHFFD